MIEVREPGYNSGRVQAPRREFHRWRERDTPGILGPTGSGKTVLVECIVGMHKPSRGRVFLDGIDVTNLKPEERHVAYVPQDYCLFPHMTVRQNIEFGMRRHTSLGRRRWGSTSTSTWADDSSINVSSSHWIECGRPLPTL